jgi:hypothetical protein
MPETVLLGYHTDLFAPRNARDSQNQLRIDFHIFPKQARCATLPSCASLGLQTCGGSQDPQDPPPGLSRLPCNTSAIVAPWYVLYAEPPRDHTMRGHLDLSTHVSEKMVMSMYIRPGSSAILAAISRADASFLCDNALCDSAVCASFFSLVCDSCMSM